MLLLVSNTAVLQLVTSGTAAIDVHADWCDLTGTGTSATVSPGTTNTAISSAATTTVVGSPTGAQRNIKSLSICNKDASNANTVTLQQFDGTTTVNVAPGKISLPAGWSIQWDDEGPQVFDASGNLQTAVQTTGRWLKRTVILNGTTSFTTSSQTNSIIARMLAAGGQGGGAPAVAGECGSGGGSGSYAEWSVSVSPSTAYTVAVGAGGSTGGTGAGGQTGGNTTFAVGATTVTCNGGVGGAAGTSISVPVLGGAGGAISTNGTLNAPGYPGEPSGCTGTAANNRSGFGASSPLGNGGAALLEASNATGNAAGGFGAGGGGASTTGTAKAGGAGSNGVIIVDEYS